jgi:hypothetical protein
MRKGVPREDHRRDRRLVIARDMQRAGPGLRSLAEPVVDEYTEATTQRRERLPLVGQGERRERCRSAPIRYPREVLN